MTPLFRKLNLGDHRALVVVDAPAEFEPALSALDGVAIARGADGLTDAPFAIVFATTRAQVADAAARLPTDGDPVAWFAYPKGTSKRLRCEFNRDDGWQALGDAGFEAVRQVAIDDDWTALRFRKVGRIGRLTRDPSRAKTESGRARAAARTRHDPTGTEDPS